jgi:hypothetical protein
LCNARKSTKKNINIYFVVFVHRNKARLSPTMAAKQISYRRYAVAVISLDISVIKPRTGAGMVTAPARSAVTR